MLFAAEAHHAHRAEQAASSADAEDPSFFPLTIPFTAGPGAISVAIALSSERPGRQEVLHFFAGLSLAGVAVALTVWIAYRFAAQLTVLLGPTGAHILGRLIAFLVVCIGVQVASTGVLELLRPLLPGGG
jgi:multiple antibiotic resistance protein